MYDYVCVCIIYMRGPFSMQLIAKDGEVKVRPGSIYICLYICLCVCIIYMRTNTSASRYNHTHTHVYIYI